LVDSKPKPGPRQCLDARGLGRGALSGNVSFSLAPKPSSRPGFFGGPQGKAGKRSHARRCLCSRRLEIVFIRARRPNGDRPRRIRFARNGRPLQPLAPAPEKIGPGPITASAAGGIGLLSDAGCCTGQSDWLLESATHRLPDKIEARAYGLVEQACRWPRRTGAEKLDLTKALANPVSIARWNFSERWGGKSAATRLLRVGDIEIPAAARLSPPSHRARGETPWSPIHQELCIADPACSRQEDWFAPSPDLVEFHVRPSQIS